MFSLSRSVLVLLFVAWGLRVAAVFAIQYYLEEIANPPRQFVIDGDADGYWQLAHRIVAGEPYQIYQPPRQVLRMPGFPALLSMAIILFGDSLLAARLLLATVGSLGCLGVYQLGCVLCGRRVGLMAGYMAALSPIFIGFSAIELTETAFATAMIWSLVPVACIARQGKERPRLSWIVYASLAGVGAGVACYLRPSWLLFLPGLAVFDAVIRRCRSSLAGGLVAILVMWLMLLPWGLRNQRVTGHFTLTTFWMGPSLYDGWNPENTTGDSDMAFFDRENLLSKMSEYEVDQEYRRRAWEFASSHPERVALLAAKKSLRYWNPFPNAVQFQSIPGLSLATLACYVCVFLPAVIGAWIHRRDWLMLAMTIGPILYFAGLHMIFVSSVRYRLPAEYAVMVVSAAGINWLCSRRTGIASDVA